MAGALQISRNIFGAGAGRAGRAVLNFIFPPLCVSCRTRVLDSHALCAACWSKISFFDGALCACCGTPFDTDLGADTLCGGCLADPPSFDRARALFSYDEHSKKLILAFKYGDRLDHAPGFARWLNGSAQAMIEEADLIVPVPLHRWRLWTRRYNQSAVLAVSLGKQGTLCDPLALVRKRPTPPQASMISAKARRRNVLGAFAVPSHKIDAVKGKSVLLVDDVLTTGATINACARALKRAGAVKVDVLVLGRVVRPLSVPI